MDRIIPFLAAFVGLVALAGAVLVQVNAEARTRTVVEEMARLRAEIGQLAARTEAVAAGAAQPAAPVDDGTVEALLALQDRMNALEAEWAERPVTTAAAAPAGDVFTGPDGAAVPVDPSWPTDDCIPIGTRFMVSSGDELAICQSPVKLKVTAVTGDNVMIEGPGVINETGSKPIPGSNCSVTVFTADAEGFAEMRVSCN